MNPRPNAESYSSTGAHNAERREPIVREMQRVLRGRIRDGELTPGEKLPSMRQLSVEFGCSLGIVKQAVNTLAAQGFLRSSPRRGVFVASHPPATREIVLVLPHLEIARLHVGLLGVRDAIVGAGYRLSIHAADPSAELSVSTLTSSSVAGALVLLPSRSEHDSIVPEITRQGVPTAVVDISPRDGGADVIAIDPVATGRLGAEHLFGYGHRRLMIVKPIGDARTPGEVIDGIERAAKQSGATLEQVEVDRSPDAPRPGWATARKAVREAMGYSTATAILGVGPQLTLGALLAAKDLGHAIPDRFSLMGLLGDSSALQSAEPAVTIYDNPLREICEAATHRLIERIDGLDEAPTLLTKTPLLIERGSVAAPRRLP